MLLDRAEVLERAEARDGVEAAEAVAIELAGVVQMDVETVTATRGQLRDRKSVV